MPNLQWLTSYLADASNHFLLSGLSGCLAFCLTWITLSALRSALLRGNRTRVYSDVGYGIVIIALLAGVACSLLGHAWLDGFALWWSTPLGPPLTIDTGPQG